MAACRNSPVALDCDDSSFAHSKRIAHVAILECHAHGEALNKAHPVESRLDAAADVWRAYFTYRTAQRKYDYAEALLTASQSSYNSNFRSYGLGLATIVDLLSAERELAAARFTIIQSKAELVISAAAVTFATGAIPPEAKP